MGSISLAMALVAGRKQISRLATGKTAFLTCIASPEREKKFKTVNRIDVFFSSYEDFCQHGWGVGLVEKHRRGGIKGSKKK
jgi:hypothetical protein